jgi:hypothetical protein
MGGACTMNGNKKNACRLLMGNAERNRPLLRPRIRLVYEYDDLGEKGWGCCELDWFDFG